MNEVGMAICWKTSRRLESVEAGGVEVSNRGSRSFAASRKAATLWTWRLAAKIGDHRKHRAGLRGQDTSCDRDG